ncbi:MAG: PHP domain-containing protein [Syntrophomonadaceae bacterium]|nr:PHP domain-containing protein [Syntrophomonadaceae bacterium]MDD3022365.1 PHP domain-containing protein [Syntrophomonadaceae bacterium]
MVYDLHVHTSASDGILSPLEIIDLAVKLNIKGIAITDHDTVDGLQPALLYKKEKQLNIDIIAGIEMNTEYEEEEVHILGYFIDFYDLRLKKRLEEIRIARFERAEKMIDKLKKLGLLISLEQVQCMAKGDLIGRPHIASALIQNGYVFTITEAFNRFIGKGRPAYVNRYKFMPEEAIDLIKTSGGIPVLAHPGLISNQKTITNIIQLGIQGIEVYYPQHNESQIEYFLGISRTNNLLITGGSDYHGNTKESFRNSLGSGFINEEMMAKIMNYRRKT